MMNGIKSILSYILINNIFIALCAVGLAYNSSYLLNTTPHSISFYGFLFCTTLFAYNLYYVQDKKHPHARWYTLIGFLGSLLFYIFEKDTIPHYNLVVIGIFSGLYILPGFLGFKSTKWYLLFKLLLLVLVWTNTSILLPNPHIELNSAFLLIYSNRFLLMWNLSMLFFIKDEVHKFKKGILETSLSITLLLQIINSVLVFYSYQTIIGLLFLFISFTVVAISYLFTKNKKCQLEYLFFVDGIMILETIFVLLLSLSFQE